MDKRAACPHDRSTGCALPARGRPHQHLESSGRGPRRPPHRAEGAGPPRRLRLRCSDRAIATVDADGISLAAIHGLYEIVKEKDAEIADLRARLGKIEALLENLTEQKAKAAK